MKWRVHVPEGCPPDDAQQREMLVYRLISGNKPKYKDFLSYEEEGKSYRPEDKCDACGVSVFSQMAGIRKLKKRVPAIKHKKVSKGTLTTDSGVTKNTPTNLHRSHCTWWIPDSFDPSPLFKVVESEDDEP